MCKYQQEIAYLKVLLNSDYSGREQSNFQIYKKRNILIGKSIRKDKRINKIKCILNLS
jgi:hypothetical protein